MIITKIHIDSFGALHQLDFDLNDNLNELCHPNGWGKSTFGAFLKAMFFGMSAKARGNAFNYERSRYLPWQGGNYGGYVEFLYQNQPYRLTRYFGKTPEGDSQELLNLTTMKVAPNPTSEIGEVVFGVGRDTFEITAFFPQLNFLPSENGEIRAGLTGANKFQDDQANLEKAVKIIDAKISQTKKELYKKDEIESKKIALGQNIAYQNVQKNNYQKLLKETEEQGLEIKEKDRVLSLINTKNELLQEQINSKRVLENKLQSKTELLSKTLLDKNAEEEQMRTLPTGKKPIVLSVILSLLALAGFGALCLINLIVGLVGASVVALLGTIITIHYVKKRPKKTSLSRDYAGEINFINKEIEALKSQIESYETTDKEIEDNSEINAQINALTVDQATKKANITNIEKDLSRLENEEEELNYNIAKMEEENSQTLKKIELLSIAKETLLHAEENVSKRFIVPLNEEFKALLNEFTLGGKDYVVDSSLGVKENTVYGQKELEYSSQGLQDILSFCQRINLITKVYKKEKPFVILDDTFVNLDDEKLEIAKKLVQNLSKDYQIFYICCNSRCKI